MGNILQDLYGDHFGSIYGLYMDNNRCLGPYNSGRHVLPTAS